VLLRAVKLVVHVGEDEEGKSRILGAEDVADNPEGRDQREGQAAGGSWSDAVAREGAPGLVDEVFRYRGGEALVGDDFVEEIKVDCEESWREGIDKINWGWGGAGREEWAREERYGCEEDLRDDDGFDVAEGEEPYSVEVGEWGGKVKLGKALDLSCGG
jgi:hypothetical protein